MPESPQTNLEELEKKAKLIIENEQGQNTRLEREPIAFGLTAVIATFAIDESISTEIFETKLKEIPSVSSAQIIDFRRALG